MSKRREQEAEMQRQQAWLEQKMSVRLAMIDRNDPDAVTIDDLPVDWDDED